MGCGQALVFPATVALISTQIDERHVGEHGLAGTLESCRSWGRLLAGC